ncbi:Lrp/AsnC family transcriptional regulator [Pseudomonas gingeri]|nr:Lrp/AsnC family transcriptional regulator [Pseudomonas gingeri]NWA18268.1 Lrp/AsnC family transcriptional regulator [Pseudomonas gingeri]NWA58942.1 Lrp/AsnC family transcriptional regulator [Pseudomonas gingeri]NWA99521.1 Lrp/AsnC family transcriptional regulator [Pseudomonas gingeri]NWB05526.1 Lrp/AsnC family transcriptional regulator [Pseudomonas gingeri]
MIICCALLKWIPRRRARCRMSSASRQRPSRTSNSSSVWVRVSKRKRIKLRIIRALIDCNQVFKSQQLLVEITLARYTSQDMRRFEQRMGDAGEVQFCYATGGGVDYIAMIQAADIDQYQRFIDQLLLEDLGIERYFTYIVTKTIKTGGALPIQALNALLASD